MDRLTKLSLIYLAAAMPLACAVSAALYMLLQPGPFGVLLGLAVGAPFGIGAVLLADRNA